MYIKGCNWLLNYNVTWCYCVVYRMPLYHVMLMCPVSYVCIMLCDVTVLCIACLCIMLCYCVLYPMSLYHVTWCYCVVYLMPLYHVTVSCILCLCIMLCDVTMSYILCLCIKLCYVMLWYVTLTPYTTNCPPHLPRYIRTVTICPVKLRYCSPNLINFSILFLHIHNYGRGNKVFPVTNTSSRDVTVLL
jgi:hypothetical protein